MNLRCMDDGVSKEEAETIKNKFTEAGATVEVKQDPSGQVIKSKGHLTLNCTKNGATSVRSFLTL